MWNQYFTPNNLSEALYLLDQYKDDAHIIGGGTDLVLDSYRIIIQKLKP